MGKKEIYARRTLRRRSTKMRVISNCSRLGKATGLRTTGGAASTTQRAGRRVSCFGTRKTQAGSRFVTRALFGGAGAMEPLPALKEIKLKDIDNRAIQPEKYVGKVLLVTNVASNCGFTASNYKDLVELYDKYRGDDFEILAFPCNQFGGQEPGSNEQIKSFTRRYGGRERSELPPLLRLPQGEGSQVLSWD